MLCCLHKESSLLNFLRMSRHWPFLNIFFKTPSLLVRDFIFLGFIYFKYFFLHLTFSACILFLQHHGTELWDSSCKTIELPPLRLSTYQTSSGQTLLEPNMFSLYVTYFSLAINITCSAVKCSDLITLVWNDAQI